MLKKDKPFVLFCLIIVCLSLLGACSKAPPNQPAIPAVSGPASQVPPTVEKKKEAAPSSAPKITPGNNLSPSITVGDGAHKSASLPGGYPSDILPIYPNSNIAVAIELDGGYTISAFAKDEPKKVIEFYKEALKTAQVMSESQTEESYTAFGTINKFTYNFDTGKSSELEGYQTSISIMLMPAP